MTAIHAREYSISRNGTWDIGDTGRIAANGSPIVVADKARDLYSSDDFGRLGHAGLPD
jgi:hypothetical protein